MKLLEILLEIHLQMVNRLSQWACSVNPRVLKVDRHPILSKPGISLVQYIPCQSVYRASVGIRTSKHCRVFSLKSFRQSGWFFFFFRHLTYLHNQNFPTNNLHFFFHWKSSQTAVEFFEDDFLDCEKNRQVIDTLVRWLLKLGDCELSYGYGEEKTGGFFRKRGTS